MEKNKKPANIRKLDETVVNRIAAGEIIQRPANALKELLENSLDAGSTSIVITVKDGGLKLLKIQDNGSGINKEDLGIVCERFTTSKLQKFEDLNAIGTFGFRGEALASISHVAQLEILTKTADMPCAYKASYSDGKLQSAPKPCAGTPGTQIIVNDLFYNVQTRKNALKSYSEEHNRIVEVVTRFAVHNASVGFTLKKHDNNTDVRTAPNSNPVDNIRILYGNSVAKDLIQLQVEDANLKIKVNGWISNLEYSGTKCIMLLFINNRLVESTQLKKALDNVYATYLAKGKHPFAYLGIDIAPNCVDVNVHPTKHEVHFLNEDAIIHKIQSATDMLLKSASTSRSFTIQTVFPTSSTFLEKPETTRLANSTKVYDKDLVRTDGREQKIDKFLSSAIESVPPNASQSMISEQSFDLSGEQLDKNSSLRVEETRPPPASVHHNTTPKAPHPTRNANTPRRRKFDLTSLTKLSEAIQSNFDPALRDTFHLSTFVGCVSKTHSLIQYQTRLYIINMDTISEEFFYQTILNNFGNCGVIHLSDPPPISQLARMGLEVKENNWKPTDGSKDDLSKKVASVLGSKSEMLDDYFSLEFDEQLNLLGIPLLLEEYIPDLTKLPTLVLHLATEVEWTLEKECFDTFSRVMGRFYRQPNDPEVLNLGSDKDWKWTVEHVLYPAIKSNLLPPKSWIGNGTILQIADLPDLYKVFERC